MNIIYIDILGYNFILRGVPVHKLLNPHSHIIIFFYRNKKDCSTCKKCTKREYSEITTQLCKGCPKFFTPSVNKTYCVELPEDIITYASPIGISMLSCAITGQFLVCFVILVFIKYRDTHIVRASSWEISITMLVGAFLCFTSPYVIIAKISDVSCRLNIIGSGLSLSLMIGSLFVKTNRIYRIFNKDVLRKGMMMLLCLSPF